MLKVWNTLVLSLFPGIGLLDRAFEDVGFCVVRGPDQLWGGDVHTFHPPADRFGGIIGGPPCQAFSQLRHIVEANGFKIAPNLIPEFERCVDEAQPDWFLMENVRGAPEPVVVGYTCRAQLFRDVEVGGLTQRERRFTFGLRGTVRPDFFVETLIDPPKGEPAVTCDMRRRPVRLGGSRKPKESGGRTSSLNRGAGAETIERMAELQGASALLLSLKAKGASTAKALKTGFGNGVPLAMGKAVAAAVVLAVPELSKDETISDLQHSTHLLTEPDRSGVSLMQIELKITGDDASAIMKVAGVLTALAQAAQMRPSGLVDPDAPTIANPPPVIDVEERIDNENKLAAAETKRRGRRTKAEIAADLLAQAKATKKYTPAATITTEEPLTPEALKAIVLDYGNVVKAKLVEPDFEASRAEGRSVVATNFRDEVYAILMASGDVLRPDGKPGITVLMAKPELWPRTQAIVAALSAAFADFNSDDAAAWAIKRAAVIEGLA